MTAAAKTPQTKKKARPKKPGSLRSAVAELHDLRPLHVPEHATLVVAWVEIPGDNTQRTQHWAAKRTWQDVVKNHFAASVEVQPHPGILANPQVHIQLHVRRAGDSANSYGRAKYVIDRLQRRRVITANVGGKVQERVYGMLDLIEDDKDLTMGKNLTIEEVHARVSADANGCKVLIWVWEEKGFEW